MNEIILWCNANEGFLSAVLALITVVVAIGIPLYIANRQDKIALFEKRYKFFSALIDAQKAYRPQKSKNVKYEKESAVVVLLIVIVFLLGFQVYNVVRLSRYDGASMTVAAGSAHAEGVTVEITNHTDEKIQVGNMSKVRLQKRVVGLWIPLWWDFTCGWTQESGPACDAGATCKQEMLWRGGYGAQGAGHYRVLQKVWADHAPGERSPKYVISAEFTIP